MSFQPHTRCREIVLQVLYMLDHNTGLSQEEIEQFLAWRLREPSWRDEARGLIEGVRRHRETIDQVISDLARNWRLDRMAAIDRNVLRLGTYEVLYRLDVPVAVAITEAVELVKRFGSAQSSRFVNGILGRVPHVEGDFPRRRQAAGGPSAVVSNDQAGTAKEFGDGGASSPTAVSEE